MKPTDFWVRVESSGWSGKMRARKRADEFDGRKLIKVSSKNK
jgi:hypothetical protein